MRFEPRNSTGPVAFGRIRRFSGSWLRRNRRAEGGNREQSVLAGTRGTGVTEVPQQRSEVSIVIQLNSAHLPPSMLAQQSLYLVQQSFSMSQLILRSLCFAVFGSVWCRFGIALGFCVLLARCQVLVFSTSPVIRCQVRAVVAVVNCH